MSVFGSSGLGRQHPSWLHQGQEHCIFCGHAYVLEMRIHCLDCDQPICPLCIVEVAGKQGTWCRSCQPDRKPAGYFEQG